MSFDTKTDKDKKKFLGIPGFGNRDRERSKSLSPKVKDEIKAALEAESAKSSKTDADITPTTTTSSPTRPKSATLGRNAFLIEEFKAMEQAENKPPQASLKPTVVDTRLRSLSKDDLKKLYQDLLGELKTQLEAKSERRKQIAQLRQTLKMKPSLFSYVGYQEEIDKLAKANNNLQKQIDAILKPAQPTPITKQPSNERGRSKSLVPYLDKPVDVEQEAEMESDEKVAESFAALEAVNLEENTDKTVKSKFDEGRKLLMRQIVATKALDDEIANLQEALKMKPSLQSIMQLQSRSTQLKEHNKLLEEKLEQYKTNPPPPEPVEEAPAPAPVALEVTPKVALTVNNKPSSFDAPLDDIPNQLLLTALGARDLIGVDSNGKSDPFCVLKIGQWKAKTKVIKKTLEPQWHQSFRMDVREPEKQTLEIEVFDADVVGKSTSLGTASYALKELPKGKEVCVWLKLNGVDSGEINMSLKALDWGKKEEEPEPEKKSNWNLQQTIEFVKEIDEKKAAISRLEKQLAELSKQLEEKETSVTNLAKEKTEQENLVKQLQSEIETQRESAKNASSTAQESATELEASLRAELTQLKNTMEAKSQVAEEHQNKSKELETKANEFQNKAKELEEKTKELQAMMQQLESENANLKTKHEHETNEKSRTEAKLTEEANAKSSLQTQLDTSTKKVSQLEDQIKTLLDSGNAGSAALQDAHKLNEKLSQENTELNAKLVQLQQASEKEIAELKSQLNAKDSFAQQLQQRLDEIQQALEAKPAISSGDVDAMQKELAVLKSVNQIEKSKAEHLNTENAALKKQLAELQEQHKSLTTQSHSLQENTKSLQQQVKELTEQQSLSKEKEVANQTEQSKKLETEVKKLKSLLDEKESQIKRRWKPDYDAHNCTACNTEFSLLNRRHHCRNCGDIYCGTCSSKKSATAHCVDPVRVCDRCFADIVNSKA